MAWPIPTRANGITVDATIWNELVNGINENHDTNGTQDTRLTAVEATNSNGTTGNAALGTRMTAVESKNTSQDAAITALNDHPYVRYDCTSQSLTTGGYRYITFDTATATNAAVTTSDKKTFTLAKAGKWLVSAGVGISGATPVTGTSLLYLQAGVYSAYGSSDNSKTDGATAISPLTKVVLSTAGSPTTVQFGVFPPGTITVQGGTMIEFTYLGQ